MTNDKTVPHFLRAAIADAAVEHFNTPGVENAFELSGFPPSRGSSKLDKARSYLRTLETLPDPWSPVERICTEILQMEWKRSEPEPESRSRARSALIDALQKVDRSWSNGKLVSSTASIAAPPLAEAIRSNDLPSVELEFERALKNIDEDPAAAITAACAILEALFKTILEDEAPEKLPSECSLKPLWKACREHLQLMAENQIDQDLKTILGGLATIVNGIGDLRTHAGSAHGRGRGSAQIDARHARLAVNAAHAFVLFVLQNRLVSNSP